MTPGPTDTQGILIRSCSGLEELAACVDLQIEVWGYSEDDVIPRRAFLVTQKIGGQVYGAFDTAIPESSSQGDSSNLIGFAMALPGIRDGCPYLHSHMLAVRPAYRNHGIGLRLKLVQREDAMYRHISLMEWTFDPLEIKNSYLNIHRLGVIVRRYTPDFYGVSSSRLQAGMPTDRLHAEWWMNSTRVRKALSGTLLVSDVQGSRVLRTIQVPAAIGEWKRSASLSRALAVQAEVRQQFQLAFALGLAVAGFVKDMEGNGVFQLGTVEEIFSPDTFPKPK